MHSYKAFYLLCSFSKKKNFLRRILSGPNINGAYKLKGLNFNNGGIERYNKIYRTKQLLSTIKPNPKRKNNEILTTKLSQKVAKTQQKVAKSLQKVAKTLQKVAKTQQKVVKFKITKNLTPQKSLKLEKRKNTQHLTYEKPLKTTKQQILSKTKKNRNYKRKT